MTDIPTAVPDDRGGLPSALASEAELDISDYLREEGDEQPPLPQKKSFAALAIGAVGVVYGDIGTSPLCAFREALRPVTVDGAAGPGEVLGLLSLLIWTLVVIVTAKYVLFLLRVDNRGEGGILALYTMVRLAIGHRSIPVLALAVAGAALFFGDAIITPAISVLSAVEGAGLVMPALEELVVPVALGILVALFLVQRSGTGAVAGAFGPVTVIWFTVLCGLGLWHIVEAPAVLAAFNPAWAAAFLVEHRFVAFAVLGAVFLAVTGAEALYADLGHFGRKPIMVAWFALVFPALVLNYLGQGALVLTDPAAARNPLFAMVPEPALPWFVSRIASLGAFFYLVMDMIIHFGVLRYLREEIGAKGWVLLTAISLDAVVLTAFAALKWQSDALIVVVGIVGMALVFLFVRGFLARNPVRGGDHDDH